MSSPADSESDDSQEYASIQLDYASDMDSLQESPSDSEPSQDSPEPEIPNKDKNSAATKDTFRVLLTGFGPYGQYPVNPSWLAAKPLHNAVFHTDPANHPRAPLPDDKPLPPLDEKLLASRAVHISTLEIPATYAAILDIVPGLHLRPPALPASVNEDFLRPPDNGYDFMFHIGFAGRGPLRLERVGHKLGYNMKDAVGQYAPVVVPQPKDFSRRAPDGQPIAIAEKMERDRLTVTAAPDIQSNTPGDTITKPNRGFGGPPYESFSDELNTDLDVTRIVQDLRQAGVEALQTIYSSMDGGHFVGDFLHYCSLAESKRSAGPYGERRNTHVLFLHCAPVGFPLKSEEVTDAIKRITLWVCNEIQISGTDDTSNLPPVGANNKKMPIRAQTVPPVPTMVNPPETVEPPSVVNAPSGANCLSPESQTQGSHLISPPPVQPRPSPASPISNPALVGLPLPPVQLPPVQPPVVSPPVPLPAVIPPPTVPSPVSSASESEYHSPTQDG